MSCLLSEEEDEASSKQTVLVLLCFVIHVLHLYTRDTDLFWAVALDRG